MDNRNSPNSRSDSISREQRRGMQQGYPVRKDADRTTAQPVNRPEGPREVPLSLRQGKIPVRKNASTGRTFPVMNRNGHGSVPPSDPAEPLYVPERPHEPEADTPAEAGISAASETAAKMSAETNDTADISNTAEQFPPEPAETAEDTSVPADPGEDAGVSAEPEEDADVSAEPEEDADVSAEPEENADVSAEPGEDTGVPAEPEEDTGVLTEMKEDTEAPENTEEEETAPDNAEEGDKAADPYPEEDSLLAGLPLRSLRSPQGSESPGISDRTDIDEAAVDTPAEPLDDENIPLSQSSEPTEPTVPGKKKWLLPLVIALLAVLALGIGIPASRSAAEVPDFDMTHSYSEEAGPETDNTAETPPVDAAAPVKFNVTLSFFDRDPIVVSTSEITLASLLEQVNYTVLESDRFSMDLSSVLTDDTVVAVDTVTYGTEKETVTIPFETKITEVQTIPRGEKIITQQGRNGSKTITYTTELVNGVEVSRTVSGEKITRQPVDETYTIGVGGTLTGNDGITYSYSYYRIVAAVPYSLEGPTYLGYDADETVVAVDKDYIPLGTKIYVKNDQFDFGVRTAADISSMIEGWEVYVWLDRSNPQRDAFARLGSADDMVIYYLD